MRINRKDLLDLLALACLPTTEYHSKYRTGYIRSVKLLHSGEIVSTRTKSNRATESIITEKMPDARLIHLATPSILDER